MSDGGWGTWGNDDMPRYVEPIVNIPMRQRRLCLCGCRHKVTHNGMANGVCLMSGCELHVRRWARNLYRVQDG